MKKLTRDFNAVTLTRREVFQIELPATPSAGYLWSVAVAGEGGGRLLTEKTVAPETAAIGGSVKQLFTFVAEKPGTFSIEATYARPWEQTPAEKLNFTITVK